jgi:hypothetical protein
MLKKDVARFSGEKKPAVVERTRSGTFDEAIGSWGLVN